MKKKLVILFISSCFLVILCKPAVAQVSFGVTISARIAPPPLVIYEQPPCPVEGYLWCPGYWAYTDDGYFWVPGVWVLPPQYGYLWTPPYWGFEAGVYRFYPGYWGPHVGFYGGVNYGYGYWGSGFGGGRWEGNRFRYNTAVVNVNRTFIHNTYIDKTVIVNNSRTNNRVSYNGGPGGIAVRPSSQEQSALRETHVHSTAVQTTQIQQARTNKAQFATVNHGRPATVAWNKPGTHVEHESVRTQPVQPTAKPSGNNNPQHSPTEVAHSSHLSSANNRAQKATQPPTIPQHYVPLTRPVPVQKEHPVPQREYSRQEHPNNPQTQHVNPQMQHAVPQQEHLTPREHPSGQQPHPSPAPAPHNPSGHNPHEKG